MGLGAITAEQINSVGSFQDFLPTEAAVSLRLMAIGSHCLQVYIPVRNCNNDLSKGAEFELFNGYTLIRTSAFHYVGVHENKSSCSCAKYFNSSVSYITKNGLFCPNSSPIG